VHNDTILPSIANDFSQTRKWYRADYGLYYQATVVLPANARHIENFETDVPNTSHRFGDLHRVNFSQIDIKGSNALIQAQVRALHFIQFLCLLAPCQSIFADTAIFRTSNSAIIGVFNTSRSLTLRTSNSLIQVDVGVRNEKEYVSELVMSTSNAWVPGSIIMSEPNFVIPTAKSNLV